MFCPSTMWDSSSQFVHRVSRVGACSSDARTEWTI